MKKIFALITLLAPFAAQSQSLDLRGFGGLMMNTGINSPFLNQENLGRVNLLGGIGATLRSGRLEYGLSLSYRRYSFRKKTFLVFADDFDPMTGLMTKPPVETLLVQKSPAFAIAPVFKYHFGSGKIDWYAGISPAYIRYTSRSPIEKKFSFGDGANGWSAEAQVGASRELIPRLRVFAELQGGYVNMPSFRNQGTGMWTGGLNFGAQFRVWEHKAAPAAPTAE